MKNLYTILIICCLSNLSFGIDICINQQYAQPPASSCFSLCSSPPAYGMQWDINYSGSYTISSPSSIAGTYSGNQSLNTAPGIDICMSLGITFTSGSGSVSIASVAACGNRQETNTVVVPPANPTGGNIAYTVAQGGCVDLTAQGRTCSTGSIEFCTGTSMCTPVSNPSSYCPSQDIIVFSKCVIQSSGNCESQTQADTITIGQTTSLDEKSTGNTVNLFPNPIQDELNINSNRTIKSYVIYNNLGKEVSAASVNAKTLLISSSNLKKGVYYIVLVDDSSRLTKRFVKN